MTMTLLSAPNSSITNAIVTALATGHRKAPMLREAETRHHEIASNERSLGDELAALRYMDAPRRKIEDVEDALRSLRRLLVEQQRIIDRERGRWSEAVCAELLGLHKSICARKAKAIKDLSAAEADERTLREELHRHDVMFAGYLRPMPTPLGSLEDSDSLASVWARDAVEHGLIDKEDAR